MLGSYCVATPMDDFTVDQINALAFCFAIQT
jgi:hypothetical protein